MAADSYWSNVSLLLHMDDAALSDVKGHAVTKVGNADYSTAQSVFGGAVVLDGSGDALSIAPTADLAFGTGDFTIEFSLYCAVAWDSQSGSSGVIGQGESEWIAYRNTSVNQTKLSFRINGSDYPSTSTPATAAWDAWAITRSGSTLRIYKNGTREASYSNSTDLSTSTTTYIGYTTSWGGYINGYVDEVRITKGVARYTGATYVVATGPFPNGDKVLSGTTKDAAGALASKLVRAHRQDTGVMVAQSISAAGTGAFEMVVEGVGPYYVTEHDTSSLSMSGGTTANAAIYDNVAAA